MEKLKAEISCCCWSKGILLIAGVTMTETANKWKGGNPFSPSPVF